MQQPTPESVDVARTELDQVNAWLAQYEQMSANHAQIEKRQAYLEGFLAQPSPGVPTSNGAGNADETTADVG